MKNIKKYYLIFMVSSALFLLLKMNVHFNFNIWKEYVMKC
jgi:hypothetical protein